MKQMSVLRILTGLLVMALILGGCVAPGGAPAPAAGDAAAESDAGDAAALACTDEIGCLEIAPDEPIHLAYMLTISGATAFLGEDSRGGIEIAIDDRGGELLGHEIELTGEDSGCSAEGGQTAAQKVAADTTVVGIIGTNCSSAATAALPIISQAGLVMISSSNTAPSLTNDNPDEGGVWQPGYYRTGHNDLFQGRVAAEYMFNELGATTLATIHDGSPYADGLQAVAAQVFQELGGEVTFQGAVNVGDTDMRPILTEIASNPPDVIYFPIFEPEGDLIAAQSTEIAGLEDAILMGADGLLTDSFPEGTGDAADGMYLTGPYVAGDAYSDFLAKWDAKFGGTPPSGFHAHAYDATNMLLNSIEEVAQVGDDGTILIGRQALRDAMSGISGFAGITGSLTCGPTGDCATGEALGVYQVTMDEITGGNWPPAVVWTPGEANE
ncbi:MAG: branched-chain amino acid ABC transporter substrate-binding protein [Caldilineaceae bacterium]